MQTIIGGTRSYCSPEVSKIIDEFDGEENNEKDEDEKNE